MEKKALQESRIRAYFIQATKEILKGEGLKAVSVRSIAERAGYSYATMYHYFKSAQELIFLCVKDFQDECQAYVLEETRNAAPGREQVRDLSLAYLKYFIQYPGIFELFYLEKVNDIGNKMPTVEMIFTFYDRLTQAAWDACVLQGDIDKEQAVTRQLLAKYAVTGMLLFYLNRRQPDSYPEMMAVAHRQLDAILL